MKGIKPRFFGRKEGGPAFFLTWFLIDLDGFLFILFLDSLSRAYGERTGLRLSRSDLSGLSPWDLLPNT